MTQHYTCPFDGCDEQFELTEYYGQPRPTIDPHGEITGYYPEGDEHLTPIDPAWVRHRIKAHPKNGDARVEARHQKIMAEHERTKPKE